LGRLSRRAGLSAIAGLSCFNCYYFALVIVVTVFIRTCFLFCKLLICYSAIRLFSRKCGIKLSVSVTGLLADTVSISTDEPVQSSLDSNNAHFDRVE